MSKNKNIRVLVACECSGTVRNAFAARGFDAWSCDLTGDENGSNRHIVADVRDILDNVKIYGFWDLVICHPPCTRLCNSGVRWYDEPPKNAQDSWPQTDIDAWPYLDREGRLQIMWRQLDEGCALFDFCLNHPNVKHVAVENPVMHYHAKERITFNDVKPFYRQPWQFADDENGPDYEKKLTGFWCRELPPLEPTGTVCFERARKKARTSVHDASPGKKRSTDRSRFFPGMAKAMAVQWGNYVIENLNKIRR